MQQRRRPQPTVTPSPLGSGRAAPSRQRRGCPDFLAGRGDRDRDLTASTATLEAPSQLGGAEQGTRAHVADYRLEPAGARAAGVEWAVNPTSAAQPSLPGRECRAGE